MWRERAGRIQATHHDIHLMRHDPADEQQCQVSGAGQCVGPLGSSTRVALGVVTQLLEVGIRQVQTPGSGEVQGAHSHSGLCLVGANEGEEGESGCVRVTRGGGWREALA
jgi:hypothetical protein